MPVEIIGEAGTPGAEREWIDAECQLSIKHLNKVCGEPPREIPLEVLWQEHDLGEYPMTVLTWEDAMRGALWEYIEKCASGVTQNRPTIKARDIDSDGSLYRLPRHEQCLERRKETTSHRTGGALLGPQISGRPPHSHKAEIYTLGVTEKHNR